ncbi:MAG: SH3 domain-containing protein [Devosia sp.]
MSFSKLYRAGALAVMLLGSVVAAQAATATTTANVNVRSGAGTHFKVIATLSAGSRVETDACHAGWCELTTHGHKGFVSQSLLRTAKAEPQRQPTQPQKPADNHNSMTQTPGLTPTPTPRQGTSSTHH